MEIKKLWQDIKQGDCDTCKNKNCKGHLEYGNLCANAHYLDMHGQANYEGNYETFAKLKKIMGEEKPSIFSFGCGLGLDYIGAVENFGTGVVYHPIDECKWAIEDTAEFKNFNIKLPRRKTSYEGGMWILGMTTKNPVICFFHSLHTISRNSDLKEDLIKALRGKRNFYIVVNFTINSTCGLLVNEREFLAELCNELKKDFNLKKLDILGDRGIIITGNRR